jgi:hypothetical protein
MDKFIFGPQNINGCKTDGSMTLGYWDGNTVTALWNYAQRYALSDAFFNTVMGGSMSGHFSLIAGNNHGAVLHGNIPANGNANGYYTNPVDGSITVIDIFDAYLDDCSNYLGGPPKGSSFTPGGFSVELTGAICSMRRASPGVGSAAASHRPSPPSSIPMGRRKRQQSVGRPISSTSLRLMAPLMLCRIRRLISWETFTHR